MHPQPVPALPRAHQRQGEAGSSHVDAPAFLTLDRVAPLPVHVEDDLDDLGRVADHAAIAKQLWHSRHFQNDWLRYQAPVRHDQRHAQPPYLLYRPGRAYQGWRGQALAVSAILVENQAELQSSKASLTHRDCCEFSPVRTAAHSALRTTPAGRVTDESPATISHSMDVSLPGSSARGKLGQPIETDSHCLDELASLPSMGGGNDDGKNEYESGGRGVKRCGKFSDLCVSNSLVSSGEASVGRYDPAKQRHAGNVIIWPHQTDCGAPDKARKAVSRRVSANPNRARLAGGQQNLPRAFGSGTCRRDGAVTVAKRYWLPTPRDEVRSRQGKFGERARTCRERGPTLGIALAQFGPAGRTAALGTKCARSASAPAGAATYSHCGLSRIARDREAAGFPSWRKFLPASAGGLNYSPCDRTETFKAGITQGAPLNSRGSRHVCQDTACRSRATEARFCSRTNIGAVYGRRQTGTRANIDTRH